MRREKRSKDRGGQRGTEAKHREARLGWGQGLACTQVFFQPSSLWDSQAFEDVVYWAYKFQKNMKPAENIVVCSFYVIFRSFSSPLDYSGSIGGWTAVVCTGLSHLLLLACLFVWRDIVKTLNDFTWEYRGFWNQSNNWVTSVSLMRNIYFDILVSSLNNTWHKKITGISQGCFRAPSKRGRYLEIHPRCRCRAGKKLEILNVTPPIETLRTF